MIKNQNRRSYIAGANGRAFWRPKECESSAIVHRAAPTIITLH